MTTTDSSELFGAIFRAVPLGVIVHDRQGRVIEANTAAERMFGVTLAEMRGMTVGDQSWPNYREDGSPFPTDELPSVIAQRTGHAVKNVVVGVFNPRSQAVGWIEASSTPLFRDGAVIPYAVATVFRDVTDERHRERERVLLERRMRLHYEVGHVGLAVTSPTKGWIAVNDRLCEIFGYTREQFQERTWDVMTHPEDLQRDIDQFQRVVVGEIDGYRLEKRFFRADGGTVWIDLSVRCLRSPDGAIEEFVALFDDITERKLQEERLLHAQKLEGLGRLAGGVAHDFNNLLSTVLANAELALDSVAEGDPLRRDLEDIRAAGQRAASLTKQLLAFGRKQLLEPRPLDLDAVVEGFEPVLRRLIGPEITLSFELARELPQVFADPGQLELVLMNLVVNARDAMPGGGLLTIRTETCAFATSGQPAVQLVVQDSGHGIEAATRERLFEPFFTTKPVGSGTGLGLSTVYGIVRQSGGEIAVDSEPGKGARFSVRLPIARQPRSVAPAAAPPEPRRRGSETILLVEDEDAVRRITRRILESAGYRVLVCADPGEALALAERHEGELHLLLTDVMMPIMSGPELAKRLAEQRPRLRVLFMSGFADGAALAPGKSFIPKPFGTAELARRVREVLDG